jgi:hypothetical protein
VLTRAVEPGHPLLRTIEGNLDVALDPFDSTLAHQQ